jgi:hypothetical protein
VSARGAAQACAFALVVSLVSSCAPAPPPRPLPPEPIPLPVVLAPPGPTWPRREVLELALTAYECGEREQRFRRPTLTIIDYSLPSNEPRLWVIDIVTREILYHELVAHGERSGQTLAVAFSNEIGSHQSSLGLFRTDEVYIGAFGYSLRLTGLEPGINDNARQRAIVVHGLADVSREFAAQWGTISTSWGCLALQQDVTVPIIDSISGGSAVFAYYPDTQWLRDSRYLHCDLQLAAASASATTGEPPQ